MVNVKKYGAQPAGCETDSVRRYGGIKKRCVACRSKRRYVVEAKEVVCS